MKGAPSSCIRPASMEMGSLGPVEVREREELGRKVPSTTGTLGAVSMREVPGSSRSMMLWTHLATTFWLISCNGSTLLRQVISS